MLDNIDDTLQAAITAHEQQDFSNAINNYQTVLNGDPNHAEANHRFGILSIQLGQIESALIFLQTAINVTPNIHEYWVPFIDALIRLDRLSDAEIVLDQASSLGHDQEIFSKLSHNLKVKKSANKEAAGIKPDFAEACNSEGSALQEQGKLEEAIEAYNKALAIKPDFAEAYYNIGSALQEQGKLDLAVEAYRKFLFIKPDYVDAYINMGSVLQEQGKLDEAIEAYKKAISLKPDFAEAFYNVGGALHVQGKFEEAMEAYKKAISIKPDFAELYLNMGVTLHQQGKLDEAIEAYKKASPQA